MKKFFNSLIHSQDPTSSKRFVGLLGSLSLIMSMLIYNTEILVTSVLTLSLGSLAITGVEKIFETFKKQ